MREHETATEKQTLYAIRKCAEWLAYCLSIGWRKADLDALERLWWEGHDNRGRLIQRDTATDVAAHQVKVAREAGKL